MYVTPCGMVIRDTLALVVEHFASTSNLKAGPDEDGRDPDPCPFAVAMLALASRDNERILFRAVDIRREGDRSFKSA